MTLTITTSDHNTNDLNTPQTIHTLTYQTTTATIDATTKLISEAHVSTRKSEATNVITELYVIAPKVMRKHHPHQSEGSAAGGVTFLADFCIILRT